MNFATATARRIPYARREKADEKWCILALTIGVTRLVITEDRLTTCLRSLRYPLLLGAVMVVLALLFRDASLVGGITAGSGAALFAAGRWIERWEEEKSVGVLREPRWRWSRQGSGGWGRGRGAMDPQDFYLVDAASGWGPPSL